MCLRVYICMPACHTCISVSVCVCVYVYEEEEEYDNARDEEEIVHTNTPSTREPSG